jgi:hypothetical protein
MSALRKPDHLTAAYKMAYLASRAPFLTGDQFKLEFLLIDHAGVQGCFPALETLAKKSGMSKTKVRRVRDQLACQGEFDFESGTGHTSTRYSIPGLAEHTAEMKRKKAPRVPESGSEGAAQAGTEPSNPSLNRKKADLRVVSNDGWEALVVRASDKMRRHWLPHIELVSEGSGGIRLRTDKSLYADRIKRELEGDGELYAIAVSLGIDPEKVVIDAPGCGPAPATPDTVPLTKRGMDEMAQRIEDRPDKPEPPVLSGNAVSLAAYKTRKEDAMREHDDGRERAAEGIPVGAAEMAGTGRDDERAEPPCDGSGSRHGADDAGLEAPRDRDGD